MVFEKTGYDDQNNVKGTWTTFRTNLLEEADVSSEDYSSTASKAY